MHYHRLHRAIAASSLLIALTVGSVRAQSPDWLAPEETIPLGIDSGFVENPTDQPQCLWAAPVHVDGANWLRVAFEEVTQPDGLTPGVSPFIRITSALDGAVQVLDRQACLRWRDTSAYFNGDSLLVELIAPGQCAPCRLVIREARRDAEPAVPRDICGTADDRVLSYDPRVARLLPIGCTGWLIRDANYSSLTAGHCATGGGGGMQVLEFNVPLSNPDGSLNHPPPQDQYAVDLDSLQSAVPPIEIGNDWAYFGVFQNSTSGLTAYEAQGDAFALADTPTVAAGQLLRKTGFGTTSLPVPRTWNQVQKTLEGPIVSATGTTLTYQIDSSGGDSGSPVTDAGVAVAIHTNGGCNTVGYNSGCSVLHPDLLTALMNPTGVCIPYYFDVTYPDGRPAAIQPLGGTELVVSIVGRNGYEPSQSGVRLHYDAGSGLESVQMFSVGGSLFQAVFPGISCTSTVRYYITAETTTGQEQCDPRGAPIDVYYAISASALNQIAAYDFETSGGWTVQNISVSGGAWERGVPAGDGTRGDPATDYDGSGQCYLTGNAPGDSDVDGGPTRLMSPAWNLTGAARPFISYARWFTNDNQDGDRLTVEISNNYGISWTPVESVADTPGWVVRYVDVAAFIPPTNVVRIRFSVADNPNDSRTEAAIDAVRVFDVACPSADPCTKSDVNLDGRIDGADISPFSTMVISGGEPGTTPFCAADVDGDGSVDIDDVPLFVDCLLAGVCP